METLVEKIQVEVDAAALAEATKVLGTDTNEETVSTAIREAVAMVRRIKAFDNLAAEYPDDSFVDLLKKSDHHR